MPHLLTAGLPVYSIDTFYLLMDYSNKYKHSVGYFMDINVDFTKRVVMQGDSIAWEKLPMKGVQRRRLD